MQNNHGFGTELGCFITVWKHDMNYCPTIRVVVLRAIVVIKLEPEQSTITLADTSAYSKAMSSGYASRCRHLVDRGN